MVITGLTGSGRTSLLNVLRKTTFRSAQRHSIDLSERLTSEAAFARKVVQGLGLPLDSGSDLTLDAVAEHLRSQPVPDRLRVCTTDDERRQTLLRTEFFDRLHEASGQNVMLALFYWFWSVTLEDDDTTLRVRPLAPIAFEGLDALPLPHAFALKALLEHGTLTVDELAEVLGLSPATSRSLLETLGNALIIAPADRVEEPRAFQFASVEYDTRYLIRHLLIHPVACFLRSRNIVH